MTHPLSLPPFEAVTLEETRAANVGDPPRQADRRITIVPYDTGWPEHYRAEETRIRQALGERALLVHHVGSTSVPGLPAKPVIDVDLVVSDSADEDAWLPDLEAAGYRLVIREPDWYAHRVLKGPGYDTNLHVFSWEPSAEWRRHRLFRDWLRDNDADRRAYGALKMDLAQRDFDYVFEYNNAKAALIHQIYTRSLAADAAAGYPSLG